MRLHHHRNGKDTQTGDVPQLTFHYNNANRLSCIISKHNRQVTLHPTCSGPSVRRSAPPVDLCPVLVAGLRNPGSAWIIASNVFHPGCWVLQLTPGKLGVVPVPDLSRRSQQHTDRGARNALAHMGSVPPCARAEAPHGRPCMTHLLGCHLGRHRGASRSRTPSPVPLEIVQMFTLPWVA